MPRKRKVVETEGDSLHSPTMLSQRKIRGDASFQAGLLSLDAGTLIEIFWPDDKTWYCGKVNSFNPRTGKHSIYYRDGDIEHLKLEDERWRLSKIKKQLNESGISVNDPSPPPPSSSSTIAHRAGGGSDGGGSMKGKRKRRKRLHSLPNKKTTWSNKSGVTNRMGNESGQQLSAAAGAGAGAGEEEKSPADSRMYITENYLSMVFFSKKVSKKDKEDHDDDTVHSKSFVPLSDDGWTLIPISSLFFENHGTTSTSRTGTKKNHKLLSRLLKRIARKPKIKPALPSPSIESMTTMSVEGKRVPKRSKIYDEIEKMLKPKSRKSQTEELPEKASPRENKDTDSSLASQQQQRRQLQHASSSVSRARKNSVKSSTALGEPKKLASVASPSDDKEKKQHLTPAIGETWTGERPPSADPSAITTAKGPTIVQPQGAGGNDRSTHNLKRRKPLDSILLQDALSRRRTKRRSLSSRQKSTKVLETFQQTLAPVSRLGQKAGYQQNHRNTSSAAMPTTVGLQPQRLPSCPFSVGHGGAIAANATQPHSLPPVSPPPLHRSANSSLKPLTGLHKEKASASTITATSLFKPPAEKDEEKNPLPHQQRPGSTSSSLASVKQSRLSRAQALRKQGANGLRNSSNKTSIFDIYRFQKSTVLTSKDSPLSHVELKDILCEKTWRTLSAEEQSTLLRMLPPLDKSNVPWKSESIRDSMLIFQRLLSDGMFSESAVSFLGINLATHYKRLRDPCVTSMLGWFEAIPPRRSRRQPPTAAQLEKDKIYERYWGEKLLEQAAAKAAAAPSTTTKEAEDLHHPLHEKHANASDPQNQDIIAVAASVKQETPGPILAPDLKSPGKEHTTASEKDPSSETAIPKPNEQSSSLTAAAQDSSAIEAQPNSISLKN